MAETVWVLSCTDQTEPAYDATDVLAVARTLVGIDRYLDQYHSDGDLEMRTNDDGVIVEREATDEGWGEWRFPSMVESPFLFTLQEIPLEEDLTRE